MEEACFKVNSEEGTWSSNIDYDGGNLAHRPSIKGGYFPVPPVDSLMDIRNAMCIALEEQGVDVEVHHLKLVVQVNVKLEQNLIHL